MAEPPEPRPRLTGADLQIRALQRERNALIAIVALVLGLSLVGRIGSRVFAIAVFDTASGSFIERAYLPQKAQAVEVLDTIIENARRRHPFYKDNPKDFEAARPSFAEGHVVRQVRRVTALPQGGPGADLPIQRAAQALSSVLHVQVNAVSLYDVEKDRTLVVLPTEAMVAEAQETRLENVGRRVSEDLKAPSFLVEQPRFLQKVKTKPVTWPVEKVLSVQQAVAYLTQGEAPAMHLVQAGERAASIAARYEATMADLARWNPGRDLTLLRTGDQLVVRRPEPPLTVLTVERRVYPEKRGRQWFKVTAEIRRHDGEIRARSIISEEPSK